MPYPAGHRSAVKKNIIDSARKLFNRHGFESVSLKQIMAGVGLTHGGFYSYFKSKSDLYAEVLGCFFTDPQWKSCWEGVHVDLSSTDVGSQVVRAYLSRQHYEDVENSCPMVALPTDVARSGVSAKRAFETVFKAMVSVLERSLVQRRHGRGSYHGRPRSGGRIAGRLHGCRTQSWRLGQKEQIGERRIQAIPTVASGSVLVAPEVCRRTQMRGSSPW
jgi:AcrR family transcriptional regulator